MRAAIYIRVSTSEQAAEGYSLAAQRKSLMQWCNGRAYDVVDVYADAERVRYIFDRYTEYRNLSAVAELCRLRGYTGKRGKVQTAESIRRVLTCPVYAGYNSYKGQLYKGRHAPIISVKDYNRVQRILQQRGKRVRILYQQIVG